MSGTRITRVVGRRIWDSRGRPTVEVDMTLACGARGRGIAPAGASRGRHEAVDLRDGGTPLGGLGVARAVANVNGPIAQTLIGLDAADQFAVDQALIALDGTPDKSRLGANAIVASSIATLQAAAAAAGQDVFRHLARDAEVRLPLPQVQIFGGGAHAGRRIDIQDLLVLPVAASSFSEALEMCAEVYRAAGNIMGERGRSAGVADEGGWWPQFGSNEEALECLSLAIERAGYRAGEVRIAIDVAASQLATGGRYTLGLDKRSLDRDAWLEILLDWVDRYAILSVEDPVGEDDSEGMRAFTAAVGQRVQVIGDDFLVTDAQRIAQAAQAHACNAALLKPNQVGTLTETQAALESARANGLATVISARSGETEDVTIVHLATGWNAGQLKVGAFARSERMAKWNEGLRIEAALGSTARFAGRNGLSIRT